MLQSQDGFLSTAVQETEHDLDTDSDTSSDNSDTDGSDSTLEMPTHILIERYVTFQSHSSL